MDCDVQFDGVKIFFFFLTLDLELRCSGNDKMGFQKAINIRQTASFKRFLSLSVSNGA